jgi:NAD(P) transhydrogenase subunit alpha
MIVGIPKETFAGEKRVAMVPGQTPTLTRLGLEVQVESGAGEAAGFTDEQYTQRGATIAGSRSELFAQADIVAQVRTFGANPDAGGADLEHLKRGQIVIGHAEPLTAHEQNKQVCEKGATLLAMELIPRITRAQAMDALSSQANLAGYMTVLLASTHLPKIFPMMMTAAGTLKPAKVFVVGAGVAGLQAIATARRLGAVVTAIDVRPETKEQVESLGARFVMPPDVASGEGGYAKELTPEQKQKQQEMMADAIAESDIVITTAAVPGRQAPVLVTEAMVRRMAPRSVVVDMAAERGGNCELTESGEVAVKHGVTIVGTTNLPSLLAFDASTMYAGNIVKLLQHLVKDGKIELDFEDEITAGVTLCHDGEVRHPQVREMTGLPAMLKPAAPEPAEGEAGSGGEASASEGSGGASSSN